jgi:hypothetical protein
LRLAAGLGAAAVLSLGAWNAQLRRELAALSRPETQTAIQELFSGSVRSAGTDDLAPVIPSNARSVLLIVHGSELPVNEEVLLDLTSPMGRTLWTGAIRPDQLGMVSLLVPRSLLRAGEYRVRLMAGEEGSTTVIGDYRWRVAFAEENAR